MWLTWGSTSCMCELAIRKVIVIHMAHEDFLISIDRLVVAPVVVLHGIAVRDLCPVSRELLGSKRIHEYEAIKRSISIVVIGHMMFRQRCNRINGNFLFSIEFMKPCALVCSQYEPTPGIDLLAYTS